MEIVAGGGGGSGITGFGALDRGYVQYIAIRTLKWIHESWQYWMIPFGLIL